MQSEALPLCFSVTIDFSHTAGLVHEKQQQSSPCITAAVGSCPSLYPTASHCSCTPWALGTAAVTFCKAQR